MVDDGSKLAAAIRAACKAFEHASALGADKETAFGAALSQYRLFLPSASDREVRDMMPRAFARRRLRTHGLLGVDDGEP